jgi:hypothetical protein
VRTLSEQRNTGRFAGKTDQNLAEKENVGRKKENIENK